MAATDRPECTIFCLDNSECAFRSEDFAPNRFAYQREATSVLVTGARLRGAGRTAGPGALRPGGPCGTAPRCAVVLAGGMPRVLVPPGQADGAALAALSAVEPDERGGGFLGGLRLAALLARRCAGARVVAFLAGAPEAPWREPELAAAARCGLSTGGLDIVLLAPEAELGAPAVAALRGLIGALDSGVDAGLPGGFVGSGCGTRRPCRLVALPAPEALLDAWQQHELLLEALDVPGARAGDPAADQGGPIGAACMPGQSRHAGRAMQGGPGSAEGGAQAGPRAGAAAAEQAAAGGALDANFSAAVESAWRSATAAVAGAGAGAPQAGAREGLGTLSRGAVGHERTSQAALGPPVGAQGGRAAPSADAANPANPRPAASPGALPALLRRRAGVLAPARCRDESLDALGHLSSDGFMRPWLPSYANVPVGLRSGSEGGSGGRAGGSGGGGGGRGGADRLVYVLMYRLDMPQWRVLAEVRAGRMLGYAAPRVAADPGTALEASLGTSAAASPRSHPLPAADLRSPNLSPPASPGRAEQAGAAAARTGQGSSPALRAGSAGLEQDDPGALRPSTIASVLECMEARKSACAPGRGAGPTLDAAPGTGQAEAGQGQRQGVGGKGDRGGGCAGGGGAARRAAGGAVPLHPDMRSGVLRLVQATDGSGRMSIQWAPREHGPSAPAEGAAPPAAQGAPSPANPTTPPPPPPPELQVALAPERVRFSAAPNSSAGGGRVLVVEQAVEAGERRRRDKHRGALQGFPDPDPQVWLRRDEHRGCMATRVTAHGRQRVECWFFWLQQAWPDAASSPERGGAAAGTSAGQALPAGSPVCEIAGPALPWGAPVAAPAPLPPHPSLDAAHAESAPWPRLDAGSAGAAAAAAAGAAPAGSGQQLSAKPRGKSMPLLARPLALGLPAGAGAPSAPAPSRAAPPGDNAAQQGSSRRAPGGGGAAADALPAGAPWGSAAGTAAAQSWAGSAAAATGAGRPGTGSALDLLLNPAARAGRPWTGAAGLAASLAALVAFPPPYDAERARREARARSTSQPLTLGPVPAALVEEVLMGGRASPAASAALAAAAASLANPGATGFSALASSALARHIRRPQSAGGIGASGAAVAWPSGSATWLPSGRDGRVAGSAGGGAGGFASGDAAAGKARSGSPGGSARRRLYRALHVARPPTLNPKPFTAAPPASPFAAAAAARRLDLDASGFMERRAGAPVATEGYGGLGASSGDDAPSDGSGNCDALGSEGGTGARAAAECRPAALGRAHSSPGDLDDARCCGSPCAGACSAATASAAAGAARCEVVGEAGHCGRGGSAGQQTLDPVLDPALGAGALHAARRAVLEGGGVLGGNGGGTAVGGGAGPAPALAVDPRKDSQPDDLTLFEVD